MVEHILIFIASGGLLFWAGGWLVKTLSRIARFLGWREFVVAFFIMALATSVQNLFVGISSILHKIPQLSFGDIVGANVLDLTLAIALAALVARGLPAESRLIQNSVFFTIAIAVLPLILILDGKLGRGDGIILILIFFFYIFWLFSKEERFKKVYDGQDSALKIGLKTFVLDLAKIFLGIIFLLAAAEGIVRSALFFAENLNMPIALVGTLIVALGTSLPETYFAIASARKKENWLILGDLMGSVIIVTTLILGIIALISPIEILDFSPFAVARIFLIISALAFLVFLRTGQRITKKEALFLLGIYIIFVITEILTK